MLSRVLTYNERVPRRHSPPYRLIEPMRRNVYTAANHDLKIAGSRFSRFCYYTVTSLSDHLHAYHTITAVVAIIMIEKNA